MSIEQKKQHKNLKELTDRTELDARYFRAQFERKFYFIKNQEIDPQFNELVAKLQAEEDAAKVSAVSEDAIQSPESTLTTTDANTEG